MEKDTKNTQLSSLSLCQITYSIPTVIILNDNYDIFIENKNKEILINKNQITDFVYNYSSIIESFKIL